MRHLWVGYVGLGLAAAAAVGCDALTPSQKAVGELTIKEAVAKTRAIDVIVNGPVALANLNGKIRSESLASVVAAGGGNVVAAGGANVVAAGGLNYKAAPAFKVMASLATYTPVSNAFVYLENVLTGKAIGNGFMTDENGAIKLGHVPDTTAPVSAIARFKLGAKEYRMAVTIGQGKFDKPIYADPINTVVEGRIRQLLRDNGKATELNFKLLKDVWGVFNDADVAIDVAALENGKTLEDLFAFYNSMVTTLKALDDKDPAHTDKATDGPRVKVVKDYMKALKGT